MEPLRNYLTQKAGQLKLNKQRYYEALARGDPQHKKLAVTIVYQAEAIEQLNHSYDAALQLIESMVCSFCLEHKNLYDAKNQAIEEMHEHYQIANDVACRALEKLINERKVKRPEHEPL